MDTVRHAVLGIAISVAGFVASVPADATADLRYVQLNGSGMCTLSIPTTDTRVRPKATGFTASRRTEPSRSTWKWRNRRAAWR